MRHLLVVSGLTVAVLLGCEEVPASRAITPAPSAAQVDRKAMAAGAVAAAGATSSGQAKIDVQDFEFGENEHSRDPFRSYEESFVEEARTSVKSQRKVIMADRAIDEMKLVGIVSGVPDAKAMLVDPTGKGHVVRRGQFLGRAEIVHGDGQGAPTYEVNWRVDRIRAGDIVLVREDPKNPEVPTATRMIPLRTEPDAKIESIDLR